MAAMSSSSVGPEDMHIYEYRLASFQKVHARRRASNVNSKALLPPFIWPHTSPSVEKLANAGFYYRPTANSIDNSSCFLCKKSLDGWEPDDIPAIEHAKHSSSCGWAIVHVTADKLRSNHNAVIEDPRGIMMYEARKMTFGNRWPHEKKKGWLPKMAKLAEAGFHYDPKVDSDDFVQCAYCELGLDGWDPEDDPLEEHKRRQSDCKFFTWEKHSATTAFSRQARPPSVDSCVDPPSDSGLSGAESTVSAAKGPKKASARGRKPLTTRRKPARSKDADSELESTPSSPPPPQPTRREPRGKKRTSSALGATRISLFDANDFADDSFVKSSTTVKPLRQSKRPRGSAASNATANEDQQLHYDSDASNAATAGTSKRKRGGAPSSSRGTTALSRYQIPDDEEIDRALELDLERELTEEEYATRYTKPFIKTPKRRLTRSKMVSQMQTEGPPPKLGLLPPESSTAPKSSKKFTPTGIRNYFANHDLDFSLPISIPRHLAVTDENVEIDRMDEDTPLQVKKSLTNGQGQVAENREVAAPDTAPEPMEEDEVIIISEKIMKKGGRKGKKAVGVSAIENAKTKTNARSLVNHGNKQRRAPAPMAEENLAPVPRLRDIRKSIDGGVVLFDGGASSSEEAQEKTPQIPPKAKGKKGKTVLKGPEHDPGPRPGQAPEVKANPTIEHTNEVTEDALPYPSKLIEGHNAVPKEATVEPPNTVPFTTNAVQAQIPSPILNPSMPNERTPHTDMLVESSGEITTDKPHTKSAPPVHTPVELCVSNSSIHSAKGDGNILHPGSTQSSSLDEALAKSFGPRYSTEKKEMEPRIALGVEGLDPVTKQLAQETVTTVEMRRSVEIYKGEKSMKQVKKGRTKGAGIAEVARGEHQKEVAIVVNKKATSKKIQREQEKPRESSLESETVRRSSTRTRGSTNSQPKYVEPETSEEEMIERDTTPPEQAEKCELNEDEDRAPYQQSEDESNSDFKPAIPKKKTLRVRKSSAKKTTSAVKVKPYTENSTTVEQRPLAKQVVEGNRKKIPTAEVVSPCLKVVHSSERKSEKQSNESFAQTVTGGRGGAYDEASTDDEVQVEVNRGSDKDSVSQTMPHDEKVGQQEDKEEEVEEQELEFKLGREYPSEEYQTEEGESDSTSPLPSKKPRTVTSVAFGEKYTTCLPLSPMKSKVSSHLPLRTSHRNKLASLSPSSPASPSAPWTPVDLDSLAPVGEEMNVDGGEVDENEGEEVNNEELLTQEERGMTVQEWVRRNAERAEEKFRERCEGVIGRLVEEGKRAVRAIEGIRGG